MPRKLSVYLWDVLDVGSEILEYTNGKTLEDYLSDRQLRRSVERCFIIIGEALVKIRIEFPDEHAKLLAGAKAIGFRNDLVHRYNVVNDDEVWTIVERSLPQLLEEVRKMLETQKG